MEGDSELEAMVDHALLDLVDLLVAGAVCSLSVLGALRRIIDRAGQFSQPLSVLFFEGPSLFQEG